MAKTPHTETKPKQTETQGSGQDPDERDVDRESEGEIVPGPQGEDLGNVLELIEKNEALKAENKALRDELAQLSQQLTFGATEPLKDTDKKYTIKQLNALAWKAKETNKRADFNETINAHRVYLLDPTAENQLYVRQALEHLLKRSASAT